jgi:hypothetical protein
MVLVLRCAAVRIGDVALIARDRISRDGNRCRMFLWTEKSGKLVILPIPGDIKRRSMSCRSRGAGAEPIFFLERPNLRARDEGYCRAVARGGLHKIRRR